MIMRTTKRYYYTDPIKAAWMAREFWVEFASHSYTDAMSYEGQLAFLDDGLPIEIAGDSLHIFEPMEGDVIRDDIDGEYQVVWKDHKGLGIDTSKGTYPPSGQIIQRNGKAFFMPEGQA